MMSDDEYETDDEGREAYRIDEDNDDKETDDLGTFEIYNRLKDWFTGDMEFSAQWRARAKEEFGFVAGDQWNPADKRHLEEQGRPVIVFNRVLSIIKAVAGIEINSRHETVYLPRGTNAGEVRANELLTAASQWMADGCDAEDEQSTAFQNSMICGMGWTEARIDYDLEPDGAYVEESIDPLEMFWDRACRKKNLVDARRVFRVRKMTLSEAKMLFPDSEPEDLDAPWAVGADMTADPKPIEQRRKKIDPTEPLSDADEVHIVHAQWWEKVCYYRLQMPDTGEIIELDEKTYKMAKAEAEAGGLDLKAVKQHRRKYKQAFLGATILGEIMDGPVPDRFSWNCITGELNRNDGTFYGLVSVMKDPQMWANKWLSQTLHILNTTAKGGIIAELDAFKDIRAASDTYAAPDAITWANKGAVSGGKIMQKPGQGIPTAYVNLLQFAISSIRDVTGINLELLGMRDANQPGILEAQRKQAAMTLLATSFDSLRRFRKNVGRVRLHYIQEYMADGRLVRITKDDGQELVPLIRDQTMGDYEVIVEDAPTSPNSREQTWATIQQVIPAFRELLTPEAVITILEYSPLPSKLVSAFKEMANKPNPDADMQREIEKAMLEIKMKREAAAGGKDEAQTMKLIAEAEKTRVDGLIDLATAGVQAAQLGLLPATENIMSPDPWAAGSIIPDEMVIDPGQAVGPQVPMVPQMPQARPANMPPQLPMAEAEPELPMPGLPPQFQR